MKNHVAAEVAVFVIDHPDLDGRFAACAAAVMAERLPTRAGLEQFVGRSVGLLAETQSSSSTRTRASRAPWSMGNPMEKSQLAALRAYHEPVSGPGRVGPHQDRMDDEGRMAVGEVARLVLLGQPRQCPVEEFDVIVGVVGSGVPRTQHGGQWLRSNQIAEVAHLVNLGAVPVDVGQGRPWVVLADPEGCYRPPLAGETLRFGGARLGTRFCPGGAIYANPFEQVPSIAFHVPVAALGGDR